MNKNVQRLIASAFILILALGLPTYPVEKQSCDGFLQDDEQQECATSTAFHSPYRVLNNDFDYTPADLGVVVQDASISYNATPIYLLVYALLTLIPSIPAIYRKLE